MTDVTLAAPDAYPSLNGARYRSARLAARRARHGRAMRPTSERGNPVPLTDPLSDLWKTEPDQYPAAER